MSAFLTADQKRFAERSAARGCQAEKQSNGNHENLTEVTILF